MSEDSDKKQYITFKTGNNQKLILLNCDCDRDFEKSAAAYLVADIVRTLDKRESVLDFVSLVEKDYGVDLLTVIEEALLESNDLTRKEQSRFIR